MRWAPSRAGTTFSAGLKAMDGTDAQGQGQLLITGQRIIGMIENGQVAGGSPLSDSTGNI